MVAIRNHHGMVVGHHDNSARRVRPKALLNGQQVKAGLGRVAEQKHKIGQSRQVFVDVAREAEATEQVDLSVTSVVGEFARHGAGPFLLRATQI